MALPQKEAKGLGHKPPKAEKPDDIPKIRKLAALKQYGFFNGIPPGFSPAECFFRQRPRGYGSFEGCRGTILLWHKTNQSLLLKPSVNSFEAQAAVMHKRRLSASGGALYNGRLCRAFDLVLFYMDLSAFYWKQK